jgi:hypothetical protein
MDPRHTSHVCRAGKKYTSNYDNIFGSKKKEKEDKSETPKVDDSSKEN